MTHHNPGQPYYGPAPQYSPYGPPPQPPKKKMSTGKKWALGIGATSLVAFGIASVSGGGDDPASVAASPTTASFAEQHRDITYHASPAESKPTTAAGAKFGDAQRVDQGDALAVVTVSAPYIAPDQLWAVDGETIWAVDTVFVCTEGEFAVNPLYFEARGGEYSIGSDLTSTECLPGETVSGAVHFSVKPGGSISKIILKGVLFNRLADWS